MKNKQINWTRHKIENLLKITTTKRKPKKKKKKEKKKKKQEKQISPQIYHAGKPGIDLSVLALQKCHLYYEAFLDLIRWANLPILRNRHAYV